MRTSSPGRAAPHTAPHGATPPLKPVALAVALALAAPHAALAAPVGHTVVAGEVSVTQPNARTMVIHQGSDKAILNWRAFSIGAGEKVQFVQPGSGSVALNRVTGGAPSEIFGRLEANGKVFLVNPAGVMFGKGASVDVGGLVASTLDIGDDDFLAGRYRFADSGSAGAVGNQGTLTAAERGTIALLGAQVSNDGTVSARLGTAGLAAGGKVTLDFNGDGLTRIVVDAARINALVENGGAIIAEGGQVTMTARALGAIAGTLVRQRGLVQATGLVERNGRILLDGGTGGVELAGRIDASGAAPGLRGGEVRLLGGDIALAAGARIDASGDAGGGTVLVGGDYRGANPSVPHARSVTMAAGASIGADALGEGAGGKVILWSDGHTSAHGSASATGGARGGDGGIVETSGRTLDLAGIRVNAGAARGAAGSWLLDPGDIVIDTLLASSISGALDNSTSVTVSTRDAQSGPGDIYVAANIEKSAGGDTTLLLQADRDITVSPGVRIASTGSAGALNVDFSADVDALFGGGVALLPGAALLTNGGNVRIYGRDNPASGYASGSAGLRDGVLLRGATIDTRRGRSDAGASGSIAMYGAGRQFADEDGWGSTESVGVRVDNTDLLTTTGNIRIEGIGGAYMSDGETLTDARGVAIDLAGGARIATGSGALDISATAGRPNSGYAGVAALYARIGAGSGIRTTDGAMQFSGIGRRGAGIDIALTQATISAGGALSMNAPFSPGSAGGGIVLSLYDALLAADGALSLAATGGQRAAVELSASSSTLRGASVAFAGAGSPGGGGVYAAFEDALIEAGSGGVSMTGTGADNGTGIALSMHASSLRTPASVSLTGSGGDNATGVDLSMVQSEIAADTGNIAIAGLGGRYGDGASLQLEQSGMSAATIAVAGDGGVGGTGVAGQVIDSGIRALAGPLTVEGSGGGSGAGVRIYMSAAQLGADQGDVRISGTGGDGGGSGVVVSSFAGESGADASVGSGGVMTGSSALVYADRDLTIAGSTGSGGSGGVSAASGIQAAGVDLTGIALRAHGGDLFIEGTGLADGGNVPAGVVLTNVLAHATSTEGLRSGTVRILAASTGAGPGLVIDGARLGDWQSDGSIIIGARNLGSGPVFSYPGASRWANAIDSMGVVTLRPDDGNRDYGGTPATAVPILVGDGATGFNASLASFGIGHMSAPTVVIGSAAHTGKITLRQADSFSGNLTLQNAGAGSAGIALESGLNLSGLVTLSSGGPVDGSGVAINAAALLLHGAQPEASFLLDNPNNRVDRFAVWFDRPATAARPEYGDVSFRNSGPLRLATLTGSGFAGLAPVSYSVVDSMVAGDLLLRSAGTLTLERNLATRGGDITLVTAATLDSGGHTLTPGGGAWRVFADTWVGENRTGLVPSQPRPNNYNCAYGDACAAAISGNRFIYRAQPTLTLTPDMLARAYGAANPALTFTPTGLVNGDTVADAISGAYTTSAQQGSSVGAYPTFGTFTSPVGYAIDARAGTLYIDRAALLISVDDKNKVYGGADPLLTATFLGLASQDTAGVVSGLTLSAPTGSAATAGSHAIVGANAVAANYAISYQPGTLAVAKAPLAVLVDDKSKVYGDADPALTASLGGFKYSDSAAAVSGLTLSTATGAAATAGAHAIVASGATAANYTFNYQPGTLVVARAPLAILVDDKSKVYGDADPTLTASFGGLKYSDSGGVVSGLELATVSGAAATAGAHPIVASGGAADNYTLSYKDGTLRVARAPLLVVADNKSKVYGAPDPLLTATLSGFRYADTAAAVSGLMLSAPTGAAAGAGNHPIVAQGGTAANYALSYQSGVLAVDPAVLTYVADPIRRLQGAAQPIPGTVTGFVYDDTLASATSGKLQFVPLAPAQTRPGRYAVEGRGLTAANYRFVQAPTNASALTALPISIDERPTIGKDITFESSKLYEKNLGSPRLCVGLGPLGSGSGTSENNDMLALEWSRVRVSPNLSNCLGLGQRNSCQDF